MKLNLDKNKKYLLACSYGPDSMALFTLLFESKYSFEVAHVNYHKREVSIEEQKALEKHCHDRGIAFHCLEVFPSQVKGNFQAWARNQRYDFFKQIVNERHLEIVLTAHHLDDVLETYLMQKESRRQTTYYGINHAVTLNGVKVIRPLLNFEKKALLDYCKNHEVPYAIDASNLTLDYKRNFIRNKVVKMMSDEEKSFAINEMRTENNRLKETFKTLDGLILLDNSVKKADFLKLDLTSKKHLIYQLFAKIQQSINYTNGVFNQVNQTINGNVTSSLFKLKNNVYFSLANERFFIINIEDYRPYSFLITEGNRVIKTKHFTFEMVGDLSKYKINSESYPITIRTALSSDTYTISGFRKKVSRLFIDMKMPKHYRLIWPLIVDCKGETIYIPRYRYDFKSEAKNKLSILL